MRIPLDISPLTRTLAHSRGWQFHLPTTKYRFVTSNIPLDSCLNQTTNVGAIQKQQRILLISAVCLAFVGFAAAFFIHNVQLPDEQSLDDAQLDEINGVKRANGLVDA